MSEWYVNVYMTNKEYGGPEEGGWWYDVGEVISSTKYHSKMEAEKQKLNMQEYCNTMNFGKHEPSSVLCEGWYTVWVEDEPAKNFPERVPHYE